MELGPIPFVTEMDRTDVGNRQCIRDNKNKNDPTKPLNATHSEQSVYKWLQKNLSRLAINQSTVAAVYTVIFSQVTICGPCARDMILWQRGLRQAAKSSRLFLSIWDIIYGKGFIPSTFPAGNGTPVTIDVIRRVPIVFTP